MMARRTGLILAALLVSWSVGSLAAAASVTGGVLGERKVYGVVQTFGAGMLLLRTRSGRLLRVEDTRAHSAVHLHIGRPVIVFGSADAGGVLHARAIWRTFSDARHWPADR